MSFSRPILYLIPFAGGHAGCYRPLEAALRGHFVCRTLELPGRGRRFAQPLLTDAGEMARDYFDQLRALSRGEEYALFGHSLGALLAVAIARLAVDGHFPPPVHLWVSGSMAPGSPAHDRNWRALRPNSFLKKIASLGGMPSELLADEASMAVFEPILRADITALEQHRPMVDSALPFPITVFYGLADDLAREHVAAWKELSRVGCQITEFDGGHFFLFDQPAAVAAAMLESLRPTPTRGSQVAQ